ncbi:MAG: NUDIX domain-containing protein [Vicinamibacterales bacterium]
MAEFVEQAGAVVYRRGQDGFRVLLVRARKSPTDWIFPKGHIEDGETPAEAAVREAEEEAGVTGRVVAALWPAVTFEAGGRQLRVQYFLVEFTGTTVAKEARETMWLPPSGALQHLTHATARALLESALERLPRPSA